MSDEPARTAPASVRGFLCTCWSAYPWLFPVAIVAIVVAAMVEGLGLSMFFPLLGRLDDSISIDGGSRYVETVLSISDRLGISGSLGAILLSIVGLYVVRWVLVFASRYLATAMAAEWNRRLLLRLYGTILDAQFPYFAEQRVGQLSNTITQEASQVAWGISNALTLISHIFTVLSYLGICLLIDHRLTLATCFLGAIGFYAFRSVIHRGRQLGNERARAMEEVHCLLFESLSSIQTIKGMGRESVFLRKIREQADRLRSVVIRSFLGNVVLSTSPEPIIIALVCGAVYIGATFFDLQIGTFLILAALLQRSYRQVGAVPAVLHSIQLSLPSLERVETALREASARPEVRTGTATIESLWSVRLSGVSYAYGSRSVLRGIDLEIRAGEMVALVGPSGGGKSTLAGILLKFLSDYEGEVLVNGQVELRALGADDWRRRIGYVSQETQLFNGTVRDNVSFFADAAERDLRQALERSSAWEFVQEMPGGLTSRIGDRGTRMSGGQRQRLALARALLRSPEILILDEATSELDSESEERIRQAIASLRGSMTILVIAHRLSTVRDADRIFVLEAGRIVESGTFPELASAGGSFARYLGAQSTAR